MSTHPSNLIVLNHPLSGGLPKLSILYSHCFALFILRILFNDFTKFLLCLVLTLPIFEVGGEGTYDAIGFPICVLYRTEDAIVHMPAFRCSAWVEEWYLFTKRTLRIKDYIIDIYKRLNLHVQATIFQVRV